MVNPVAYYLYGRTALSCLLKEQNIDDGKDATCFMYFSKEEIYHGYGCKKQHECSFRAQHFKH